MNHNAAGRITPGCKRYWGGCCVHSALDAEYNRLIDELSELNREISEYRSRVTSTSGHNWHEELDPIIEKHRLVTARLREIVEIRAAAAK
jgi:hypothetical protein